MTTRVRPPSTWGEALAVLTLFTLFAGDFWRDLIGWPAYLALAGALAVLNAVWLIVRRPRLTFRKWPKMLLLFLALAAASTAWSQYTSGGHPYRLATVLALLASLAAGAGGLAPALVLDRLGLLRVLGSTLRWVIGLSALFELWVSLVLRHPILPLVRVAGVDYSGTVPNAFYWSRDNLFHGGQIQGIVGNGDLLAMCALVALIVFGVQLADRTVHRAAGWFWILLAAAELLLARSATVLLAAVGAAAVLGFALWGRHVAETRRLPLYGTIVAALVVGVGGILTLWEPFTRALGKSADLTGRTDIWHTVIGLAQQHPAFGWGWMSYWAPWVEPFQGLAVRHGVQYLQAHNAWLDVWLQLGFAGVAVFGLLVLTTLGRAWFLAVDRPRSAPGLPGEPGHLGAPAPFRAVTLLPLLVLSAQLVQSFAESRLIIESGWALLVIWSVTTKAARP